MANRVKHWRKERGLTLDQLGEMVGADASTISKIEKGHRQLTGAWMTRLAKPLQVEPRDLLSATTIPLVGYVGAGAQIYPIDDHAHGAALDEIEAPPGLDTDHAIAVRVQGDSMIPAYYDGDIIVYQVTMADPITLLGRECVVKLADGRTFIKRLAKGSAAGFWTLRSYNAADIEDVVVEWAARVNWIKRADN